MASEDEHGLTLELDEKLRDQLRLSGIEVKELEGISRRALARELLQLGHLSLGLAAELAGVERGELARDLAEHNTPLVSLPQDEIERELKLVDTMMGKGKQS